ncbi:hypothetical protein [Hugenholtzia roseola]|uniref:hypothetical protein n=1 Tax=Hugenholtzia roseola TaxID=1002 RepID=UPI00047E3417|nr:hypothetical protein [Hugenholtzia roseola]
MPNFNTNLRMVILFHDKVAYADANGQVRTTQSALRLSPYEGQDFKKLFRVCENILLEGDKEGRAAKKVIFYENNRELYQYPEKGQDLLKNSDTAKKVAEINGFLKACNHYNKHGYFPSPENAPKIEAHALETTSDDKRLDKEEIKPTEAKKTPSDLIQYRAKCVTFLVKVFARLENIPTDYLHMHREEIHRLIIYPLKMQDSIESIKIRAKEIHEDLIKKYENQHK